VSDQLTEFVTTVELLDGRHASLRRLTADDAEAVMGLHQNLSDHDRYLRFFTLRPAHLDQLVSNLIAPGKRQCALGAFDADRRIGLANYVVSTDHGVAEIAIVVAYEDHLLGVGTALLRRLAQIGRSHGIRRLVADVMAENRPVLKVASDLGRPVEPLSDGSVHHLVIELPQSSTEALVAANELSETRSAKCVRPQRETKYSLASMARPSLTPL